MNYPIALIYLGFFTLIGAACYFTSSGIPLLALVFMPNIETKNNKKE